MNHNKWGNQSQKPSVETELLLELLEGTMQEEGYEAIPLGEIKNKFSTSDGTIRAIRNGKTFSISVNEVESE